MTKKIQMADWFSAGARVVEALGKPEFARVLTEAMRRVVPFEFTVIFAYPSDRRPLDLYDDFPEAKRRVMIDDYQEGPYLLDPLYQHSAAPTASRVVRLRDLAPDRFYQGEYFRNYYVQTGLAEEVGFIVGIDENISVVISAMRANKVFSAREFRDLDDMFPFIAAAARHHWKDLGAQLSDRPPVSPPRLPQLIEQAFQSFGRNLLTPREAEIVEYVLKGYSAEATGAALGISPGTVRIHRRNIYAKLRVSSQGELFSSFIASLADLE
ncbi:helix-turn-helix transcriptional regulator [Phaeovulum sp. W22_SRMD_FR3]|uniref:helix-turn-helix transcriptional regulator n=1 Tax=Phaeovulum sp. W22_SRMD_FR3 TaxID=3240274 RepID=UPI003F9792BC